MTKKNGWADPAGESITLDGNEAAARVAYKLSEVIAIYPITPSTPMGELADDWASQGQPNLWGTVPRVLEMQSEGGAAGAIHGALQTGSLTTTFTASQGLLLMLPNMYKIAGELTPAVFHVAARSLAAQALSIFGDHSDVMAARLTGWAMLASSSVQEAQDLALIAHAATLESRLPFLHFFDGFRTSHEINKITPLTEETMRAMIDDRLVYAHRQRALSPDHPFIRGTAQNPDVYFQARESVNPYYNSAPVIVQQAMDRFAELTGRQYRLFEYTGSPEAERVIVIMGSGAETAAETAHYLTQRGEAVGVLKVHLFRPFSIGHFLAALPPTVRQIAVLDRTKEPGSAGEPLYLDVVAALEGLTSRRVLPVEANAAEQLSQAGIIGGRYGLSSKEFTPAMVRAIFEELERPRPKNHFTIGIQDDLTHSSLDFDPAFSIEDKRTVRCIFWGLGSDGTVGANKNSIKIIGEHTANYAQGYFVYDSKKSGSMTVSHLRFGPKPIHAPYLIEQANFIACHQSSFLQHINVLKAALPGGVFLLNTNYGPEEVWEQLPRETQETILTKKLHFYVIDAERVARENGMGGRINTVMQTCFFAISGVLPRAQAITKIKESIRHSYSKRGEAVVQRNYQAVDQTLDHLYQVEVPDRLVGNRHIQPPVPAEAPQFVREVLAPMIAGDGDNLPVSALPADGTYPAGTSRWEKRGIAVEIPRWESDLCIQCGKCVMVCPHSVIRQKVYEPLDSSQLTPPPAFESVEAHYKEFGGYQYTLQVSALDCTGCGLCVAVCPAKDRHHEGRKALNMVGLTPELAEQENQNWDFFQALPEVDRTKISLGTIKNSQLLQPLFEFSGACAGCGETPYLKLITQLFGDRSVVANATGCSSIYGGNLPTTPWSFNAAGRGPAWSNSLFEDNAEFGLGMRVSLDKQLEYARELLPSFSETLGPELVQALLEADQTNEAGIAAQRERVARLKERLAGLTEPKARALLAVADGLVRRTVWIVGGDGWAYDIGYGGLDHVLASGRNVNVLVLNTQVYSNTGGQASKATPLGAVAKFASGGKSQAKKDLGLLAMSYGYVYVAQIAMGANDQQTLQAFLEAEAYDGPSLIVSYAHCIQQGIDMGHGLDQQKLAVQSGAWPLYRFNPALKAKGQNPFRLDSKEPSVDFADYAYNETRYKVLQQNQPAHAAEVMEEANLEAHQQYEYYEHLAELWQPPKAEK